MAHEAARRAGEARPQYCSADGSDTSIMMDILFLSAREGVVSRSTSFERYEGRTQANRTLPRFDLSSISAARLTPSYLIYRVHFLLVSDKYHIFKCFSLGRMTTFCRSVCGKRKHTDRGPTADDSHTHFCPLAILQEAGRVRSHAAAAPEL